jgi:hypothetical protein
MMDERILGLLHKKLEDRRLELVENLAGGAVADYAAYRELCGFIRGLQTAQFEIADLVRKLKDSDDD